MDFTDSDLKKLNAETFRQFVDDTRILEQKQRLHLFKRLADLLERAHVATEQSFPANRLRICSVYNELASVCENVGQVSDSIEYFRLAFADASSMRDIYELYTASHGIGLCLFRLGEYEEAGRQFQLSAAHANYASPLDMVWTLQWIAACWQRIPDSISHAAAIYDWICLLQPTWTGMYIEKYRCLVASGDNARVQRDALATPSEGQAGLASAVAANLVLRRKARACRLSREGLLLAVAANESEWQGVFATFLSTCPDRPIAPK